MEKKLWAHQIQGIKAGLVLRDLGLFFDVGTGKTRTLIEILRRRYAEKGKLRKTLILAPIIVCPNWKKEFAMYSKISPRDIVVLTGSGVQRTKQFLSAVGDTLGGAKIIITNYETTQMNELYKLIMLWTPEILVCDESQRIKNPESTRAKAVVRLADLTEHNFLLTGTPILNSSADVFMQFRALDRGETFGKNFFAFRNEYFHDVNASFKSKQSYFPKWEPRPGTYQRLQDKIRAKAVRAVKSECLDLPPLVRQTISVSLSKEQAKAYREMYNDYVAWIDTKSASGEPAAVVAQLAITKALRLQQIVSGFAKDDNDIIHRLPCPRLSALKDVLESLPPDAKVIIWAVFQENYKQIAEVVAGVGREYRELHGLISHKDREQNMNDFRSTPGVTVMIANQGAGGVGINLVEASYAIYYSKGFKLEDDLQSEARSYRGGSEIHEKITRIDLVCEGTLDTHINEALQTKQNIGNTILGWTKDFAL